MKLLKKISLLILVLFVYSCQTEDLSVNDENQDITLSLYELTENPDEGGGGGGGGTPTIYYESINRAGDVNSGHYYGRLVTSGNNHYFDFDITYVKQANGSYTINPVISDLSGNLENVVEIAYQVKTAAIQGKVITIGITFTFKYKYLNVYDSGYIYQPMNYSISRILPAIPK